MVALKVADGKPLLASPTMTTGAASADKDTRVFDPFSGALTFLPGTDRPDTVRIEKGHVVGSELIASGDGVSDANHGLALAHPAKSVLARTFADLKSRYFS